MKFMLKNAWYESAQLMMALIAISTLLCFLFWGPLVPTHNSSLSYGEMFPTLPSSLCI